MMITNIFKITNKTEKDLILYSKVTTEYNPDGFMYLITRDSFLLVDLIDLDRTLDLDKCYFKFLNTKQKISVRRIKKFNCQLEYSHYARKNSSSNDNFSDFRDASYSAENDVHAH